MVALSIDRMAVLAGIPLPNTSIPDRSEAVEASVITGLAAKVSPVAVTVSQP